MKKTMMITALLLVSGLAQAATSVCGVTGLSKTEENTYNRQLATKIFNGDGKIVYAVDRQANEAFEVDLTSATPEIWKKIDGKNLVFIEVKDSQAQLFVSRVNLADSRNATKITAGAIGSLGGQGRLAYLMLPNQKFSIVCSQN